MKMKTLTVDDLFDLIDVSETFMRRHRGNRRKLLEAYAGPMYAGSEHDRQPINLHFGLAQAWLPNLVVEQPVNLVTTDVPELRPVAKMFGKDLDHLYGEIDYAGTLRMVVMDALVGAGIIKTGLGAGAAIAPGVRDTPRGYLHDVTQPFSDRVSLDDYGIDPTCQTRERAWIEYDTYPMPLNYMQSNPKLFEAEAVGQLTETHYLDVAKRAESISQASGGITRTVGDIIKLVNVRDVWLPKEGLVVTVPAGRDMPKVLLREVEWKGSERGPYEMLGLAWCPDNVLPVPLMAVLHDLHVMQNKMASKAGRQAERSKRILLVEAAAAKEGEAVKGSGDGDVLYVNGIGDKFMQVDLGGTSEELWKYMAWTEQQYSQIGGNTDLIGGVSAKSKTLGQDQILDANTQIRLGDSRAQVGMFAKANAKKLGWYIWTDKARKTRISLRLPGVSAPLNVMFGADDREGSFDDFGIDIDVHSMMLRDPGQQYALAVRWIKEVAAPLIPIAQAQGLMFDVQYVAEMTAGWLHMRELAEVFVPILQQMVDENGQPAPAPEAGRPLGTAGGNQTFNVAGGQSHQGQQPFLPASRQDLREAI